MKAWEELLKNLEKEIGASAVSQWLRPIKVVRFDAANLYLEPSTPFQQAWFEEHIQPLLSHNFVNNNQRPIRVHWQKNQLPPKPIPSRASLHICSDFLEKDFQIETFFTNEGNALAYQMVLDVSNSSSLHSSCFNPLFFSGPKGSGKTHLLTGIAQALAKKDLKVFFIRAETFTEHVVQAIRIGFMNEFRKAYREIDVLLLDDVHLFAKRDSTQEEFFHTFNALHTLGKQIILSSRVPPGQLEEIEPRLISRFEWGISLRLEKLEGNSFLKMIELKAKAIGLCLDSKCILFLSQHFTNPKALAESLHALELRKGKGTLSIEQIKPLLEDLLKKENDTRLSPEKINQQVATYFGICPKDLIGKSQTREIALPRQIAMYLCRKTLHLPFQQIGKLFTRDHSTVMANIKQIQEALALKNQKYVTSVEAIIKRLSFRS